jgi:fumarylacetoacetase
MYNSEANNPALISWVPVPSDSDFPIQNIPFGVFNCTNNAKPRAGSAIGGYVIDLEQMANLGYFDAIVGFDKSAFSKNELNDFIALGKTVTRAVREKIAEIFRVDNPILRDNISNKDQILIPNQYVTMHLPFRIGDYTDFYSSREHATNVGTMFRDPNNALLPNWLHIPVGYHGRSSSIVVSGTPVRRPYGQTDPNNNAIPVFGPSKQVDFELEVAFVLGSKTELGKQIKVNEAEDHIFGLMLFNDWSARDIQKWEYVPLGPFLAKNFASSLSPWVVTIEALEPLRTNGPEATAEQLPYLQTTQKHNFDIQLEVVITPENGQESVICRSNFKHMYWSMAQQLAHHTVNGCNMNVGDLCASGTISGPTPDSYGSMLELAWKGTKPLAMNDGSTRTFILDNDTVIMRGYGIKDGVRIGFGEVTSKLLPANPL